MTSQGQRNAGGQGNDARTYLVPGRRPARLDGLRCLICADDLVFRSRGGKTLQLPHIMEQLARILPTSAPGCSLV
jgi:hypothetical protein